MSAIKLHMLKPSVNNMSGARVRARGQARFHRGRRLRQDPQRKVLGQEPGASDADDRGRRPAQGRDVGELRDHAVSLQQASISSSFYPKRRRRARWSTARCSISSARSIPMSRARPIRRWASRNMPARSARATPTRAAKAAAQKAAAEAIAEPLDVFHKFYMDGKPFIGGDHPSIADIRLAATLEFLAVIDYPLPGLGEGLHGGDREGARRRLCRAGGRRARLHRLREVAEEIAPDRHSGGAPAAVATRVLDCG